MELQRIEYLRKNDGLRSIDPDNPKEKKMVSKGKKRGVLYCGIDSDDENSVVIGFSLCNTIDRFDYISGIHKPGFGLELAKLRSEKWKDHTEYFVQKSFTEADLFDLDVDLLVIKNPNNQEVVEIPPSIFDRLTLFIERCKKYYKDKDFPEWIERINRKKPYPELELQMIDLCDGDI